MAWDTREALRASFTWYSWATGDRLSPREDSFPQFLFGRFGALESRPRRIVGGPLKPQRGTPRARRGPAQGIRILILDEADRMLDMGFEPQVAAIVRRIPKERQTMFFSASLEGAVGQLAARYTKSPIFHEVVANRATVDEAGHRFIPVSEHG